MRYVALLRGINVGKRQRIAMADLRGLLTGLGYLRVKTLLNSGNAVFDADGTDTVAVTQAIEQAIATQLGLNVRCVVRTHDDMRAVVAANPLSARETDGSRLLVVFLSDSLPAAAAKLDPTEFAPEEFGISDSEIYTWHPESVMSMRLTYSFWEKRTGLVATARNWNTVLKLDALASQ